MPENFIERPDSSEVSEPLGVIEGVPSSLDPDKLKKENFAKGIKRIKSFIKDAKDIDERANDSSTVGKRELIVSAVSIVSYAGEISTPSEFFTPSVEAQIKDRVWDAVIDCSKLTQPQLEELKASGIETGLEESPFMRAISMIEEELVVHRDVRVLTESSGHYLSQLQ